MKILIINLPRFQGSSVTREGRCEFVCNYRVDTPATLLIIASLLRDQNHEIDFIDTNALDLDYEYIRSFIKNKNPECVIFTFNSWIIDFDLKICEIVKQLNPSCRTIGYSWFAKKQPVKILNKFKYLDIQIIDDPFSIIERLISSIDKGVDLEEINGIAYRKKNNEIKVNKNLSYKKGFDKLPLPAYGLIKSFKPYYLYTPWIKPYALVYAGRGCPYTCAYCPDANTKYSGRSANEIFEELKVLKKIGRIKYVWFYDQVFTINRKRVIQFCNKIIEEKLKVNWFCDTRADLVDEELLKLMKKAGCIGIAYGIESGSQKILDNMNKSIKVSQAIKALEWTRKAGIPIQLNLILGYIGENKNTLKETAKFIRLTHPEILQISFLIAMRGTEFTELAIRKKWIVSNSSENECISELQIDRDRYKPYQLNYQQVIKEFYKILFLDIRWWINGIRILVKTYQLIFPLFSIIINRTKSIKII